MNVWDQTQVKIPTWPSFVFFFLFCSSFRILLYAASFCNSSDHTTLPSSILPPNKLVPACLSLSLSQASHRVEDIHRSAIGTPPSLMLVSPISLSLCFANDSLYLQLFIFLFLEKPPTHLLLLQSLVITIVPPSFCPLENGTNFSSCLRCQKELRPWLPYKC